MNILFFLKKYFINFNLVCMFLGMCMYVQCPLRPEEGVRFFGVQLQVTMTHLIRTLRTELWSSAKKVIYSKLLGHLSCLEALLLGK